MAHMPLVRSALYVPANRERWVQGCDQHGADAVLLDLEDATPPADKERAREIVAEALPVLAERGQLAWVRINPLGGADFERDLATVCRPGLAAVCLPKVAGPADVIEADRVLAFHEGRNGLDRGSVAIIPLLESAQGLWSARDIFQASDRVAYAGAVAGAGGDLEHSLGSRWRGPDWSGSLHLRSHGLLAARAAGVVNPMSGLVTLLDTELLAAYAEQTRDLGYEGMFVIHPDHVSVVNKAFTPSPAEYERSRDLVERYAVAVADSRGTTLDSAGQLVDAAMLRSAQGVIDRYALLAQDEPTNEEEV
jgi:citrate lyase subunit beta/citryl-CoA lyase